MMNQSLKSLSSITYGTVVIGKWHRNRYRIIKQLGYGANGVVYLADWNGKNVAIKMSNNSVSITSEVNVLKSFSKVQGYALGPSLIDIDDWAKEGTFIPFYVMEYIEGLNFVQFIQKNGYTWVPILILQLLNDLHQLHMQGWVFGDLKPENLIVSNPPPKIRCIDVGGTTLQGRAIKEYTEFFDRGYWGLGGRKAEPSYDLFAVAMVMINAFYPKKFERKQSGLLQLKEIIKNHRELSQYEGVLIKALSGKYQSALEMRDDIIDNLNKYTVKKTIKNKTNMHKKSVNKPSSQNGVYKSKKSSLFETVFIVFVISLFYALYVIAKIY